MVTLSDPETELALIGSILIDREAYVAALDLVPSDFTNPACAHVFEAVCYLDREKQPIESHGIARRVAAMGGTIPPTMLYGDLAQWTGFHADLYVERVAALSAARKLLRGLKVVCTALEAGELNAEDAPAAIKRVVGNAAGNSRELRSIYAVASGVYQTLVERSEARRDTIGIRTGIGPVDQLLKGLQPKKLVVVAARPGIGKSALALQFASKCADLRHKALVFSLEMDADELVQRLLAQRTRIPLDAITMGRITVNERRDLHTETGLITELPLVIDDKSRTIGRIAQRIQRERMAGPIGVVVVDYIQLVASGVRGQPREQEVATVSRQLKGLATDNDCCVVALSQLNRASMQRADKRPLLSDLRESGAIEQDADAVLFLHRESMYGSEDDGNAEVIIAKNRGGVAGTMRKLAWHGPTVSFSDADPRESTERG